MAGDQRLQLEFIVGVEAAGGRGDLLAQQPVGADDSAVVRPGQSRVDHQKVIAKPVEMVRTQAEVEQGRLVTSIATVQYLAWAIPAIGFLGTVRGLAGGMSMATGG